LLQGLNIKVSN